jgi:SAM-dependent methyltransferase
MNSKIGSFASFVMSYTEKGDLNADGRMDTPAFHRNQSFVVEVLKTELGDISGDVLEVGSGSGQHVAKFAETFPNLTFWPTDLDPEHIQSIEAWRRATELANIQKPFLLDVTSDDWEFGTENRPPSDLAAIISLNMIHISPISVAKNLFRGAGDYLSATGKLFLYGPFKRNGEHTAPSNAQFDATLRARDPAWGVRDVTDLEEFASANDLLLDRRVPMPSNNFTLIFSRRN